jgi:hypothetical protein
LTTSRSTRASRSGSSARAGAEHHGGAARPGRRGGVRHRRQGHLQLAEQHVGGGDRGAVGLVEASQLPVGAGRDDDEVLRLRVDRDQRDARGSGHGAQPVEADPGRPQALPELAAERVVADRTDERAARPGPGRRDRLVGALAAGHRAERSTEDGLAGPGQRLRGDHQVQVGAAHHDHRGRHAPVSLRSAGT